MQSSHVESRGAASTHADKSHALPRGLAACGLEGELRRCVPDLAKLATKLCRNQADASDLVQDTLERALQCNVAWASGTDVRAWLRRVLHNLFIDHYRRRRRMQVVAADSGMYPVVEFDVVEPEPQWAGLTQHDLLRAVDSLPRKFRDVYVLHSFGHSSYEDIAVHLGISSATVGSRLCRARRRLKLALLELTSRS